MSAFAPIYRSLAALHRAGVPWSRALEGAGGGDPRWSSAAAQVAQGAPLADALVGVVDPLDRAVLRAGEASGTLEGALENLAARHEEEDRMRGARRTGIFYPVAMTHVTAVLAGAPDWITGRPGRGLLWVLAFLGPLYLLLWLSRPRGLRRQAGPHPGTRPPRPNPVTRNAIEEADARALTAFADCYDAGMPLGETLELAESAGAGGRVAFDLHRARPRVADGLPLSGAWQAIPAGWADELRVGEGTGELGRRARQIAARAGFDVVQRRKRFASVLPVALLLATGAVVAWRLVGFYSQVYSAMPR